MKNFYILDEREIWHAAACKAAVSHGYKARRIRSGAEVDGPGVGFIRPHADWRVLPRNRLDYMAMCEQLVMIQDPQQVEVYEDKSLQFAKWSDWMPETHRFTNRDEALTYVSSCNHPIVSKADVGASSHNVRILYSQAEATKHIFALFGEGVNVHHGAKCPETQQQGYALLQRFVPHKITYRVNAMGDARAIFFRYCYPNRNVAQTGNVAPAFKMTEELESLLEYCDKFFAVAQTKWCALDVLKDGDNWRLLETSLAWPWPSPGECNSGTIFRSGGRKWIEMFEVMFDELERGAWGNLEGS